MNRSSMSKQMTQKDGPAVPSKEEFAAMTPEQQAAQKKKAMMQNLNLTPKEKAAKEAMEKENMGDKPKKMNMGGMATANKYDKNKKERRAEKKPPEVVYDVLTGRPRRGPSPDTGPRGPGMKSGGMTSKMSKQKGGNTVIVDPAKKSPKSRMKTSGSGSKMAMMKEGGNIPKYKAGKKVRGYGKARGGKACKMR